MTQGVYALVLSRAAITDIIGDRFYPRMLPQGLSAFPAATFRMNNNQDNADFDGPSTYDFAYVDIHCYGRTYGQVAELYEVMRKQTEAARGTFGGVDIAWVRYMDSGVDDYLDELELFTKQLELRISYLRTPN